MEYAGMITFRRDPAHNIFKMAHTRKLPRRDFLQWTAAGLAGTVVAPLWSSRMNNQLSADEPTPQIALQLYTLRKEMEKDMKGTLQRVAGLGYKTVETAFWPAGVSVADAAVAIREAGLNVCSAHIELPVNDQQQQFLDAARAYGCQRMIWHGWPEDLRYGSPEGVRELAVIYNNSARFAQDNGLQFGLHNHWWEFRNKVEGRYVYQWLLDLLDPDVFFELDTYWVKVAGHDPAEIVKLFGDRAPMLHMKDGPARWTSSLMSDHPEPMTALGKGTQDIPAIAAAGRGHTKWMVVEMDVTATDVFAALRESLDYLVTNNIARTG